MTMKSRGLPRWLRNQSLMVFLKAKQNGDGYLNRGYAGIFAGLLFANNSGISYGTLITCPRTTTTKTVEAMAYFNTKADTWCFFLMARVRRKSFSTSIQFGSRAGIDTDLSYIADVGFTYRPDDRLSIDFDLGFVQSKNWYLHQGGNSFTSFDALQIRPGLSMDYFISHTQQLRFSLQWIGIVAEEENAFWQSPDHTWSANPQNEKRTQATLTTFRCPK